MSGESVHLEVAKIKHHPIIGICIDVTLVLLYPHTIKGIVGIERVWSSREIAPVLLKMQTHWTVKGGNVARGLIDLIAFGCWCRFHSSYAFLIVMSTGGVFIGAFLLVFRNSKGRGMLQWINLTKLLLKGCDDLYWNILTWVNELDGIFHFIEVELIWFLETIQKNGPSFPLISCIQNAFIQNFNVSLFQIDFVPGTL